MLVNGKAVSLLLNSSTTDRLRVVKAALYVLRSIAVVIGSGILLRSSLWLARYLPDGSGPHYLSSVLCVVLSVCNMFTVQFININKLNSEHVTY